MELKDETYSVIPESRQGISVQGKDIGAVIKHITGGRPVQRTEDMQECALPRTRCPDYPDHLSFSDRDIDPLQYLKPAGICFKRFCQILRFDQTFQINPHSSLSNR